MSFDWKEFNDLALALASIHTDEASHRTAISRAYYAAYHEASAYIRARALCPASQPLTHRLVWRLIREAPGARSAVIANLGFDLRNLRESADYRNPYPGVLSADVNRALVISAAMIAWLNEQ